MADAFEDMLKGGHPNSLGRTIEVVEMVLKTPERFAELFDCYQSGDEVVRLRVSNAMKRVETERHDLLLPYLDRFISEVGQLDQASAQWTLAQLFQRYGDDLSPKQRNSALELMKRNIAEHSDWIVLTATIETLSSWATLDDALKQWFLPHLKRLSGDTRKSVAKRAAKKINLLKA